ncbi:MAG: ATP-binding protein [Pseudomonadota bacterium]
MPDGTEVSLDLFVTDAARRDMERLLSEPTKAGGPGFQRVAGETAQPEHRHGHETLADPGSDASASPGPHIMAVTDDYPAEQQQTLREQLRGEPVLLLRGTGHGDAARDDELLRWLDVAPVECLVLTTEGAAALPLSLTRCLRRRHAESRRVREPLCRLAAAAAHDLNNLATVLTGNLRLLQTEDPVSPVVPELVEECDDAAARLRQLAANLSIVGGPPASTSGCSTRADLSRAVALAARLLAPRIEVRFDFGTDWYDLALPVPLMEAVVLNLALNARDAMPAGGELAISATFDRGAPRADRSGRATVGRVRFCDSGAGLSAWPATDVTGLAAATRPGRAGLGLRMVREAIHAYGGQVGLASPDRTGTIVELCLPLAPS